jgi:hypothetical protein
MAVSNEISLWIMKPMGPYNIRVSNEHAIFPRTRIDEKFQTASVRCHGRDAPSVCGVAHTRSWILSRAAPNKPITSSTICRVRRGSFAWVQQCMSRASRMQILWHRSVTGCCRRRPASNIIAWQMQINWFEFYTQNYETYTVIKDVNASARLS